MNDERLLARSATHQARVEEYLNLARSLQGEGVVLASGELLYLAAKRAVNAHANLNGENPTKTGSRRAYIRKLADTAEYANYDLLAGWTAVNKIHGLADQEMQSDEDLVSDEAFTEAWLSAEMFVVNLLDIIRQAKAS